MAKVDEELYSRQLYVIGRAAQSRVGSAAALLCGCSGVGAEAAKNLVLMGIGEIALSDPSPCELSDLSCCWAISENDVTSGTSREEAVQPRLAELNGYVTVTRHKGGFSSDSIARYKVVIVTGALPLRRAVAINAACRSAGVAFVYAPAHGCLGAVFCDFGSSFHVHDTNGEDPIVRLLDKIEADADGTVRVDKEAPHGLSEGDLVTFAEVPGMPALDGCKPRPVTRVVNAFTFCVGSIQEQGRQTHAGGYVKQVKQGARMSFRSLEESLVKPDIMQSDFFKISWLPATHALFCAMEDFRSSHGRLPAPWDMEEAEAVVAEVEKHVALDDESMPREAAIRLAATSGSRLAPMASVIGALAASESLKAVSGKFTPIKQWLYIEASEALPKSLSADQCVPRGDRYDGQRQCFGADMQDKLCKSSWFVVGAGAIGCELLKLAALMGLASPPGDPSPAAAAAAAPATSSSASSSSSVSASRCGRVVVTDMDIIERSNLSRQFLFRNKDVGLAKSVVAAAAARQINPLLNIEARETRVGPESERVFDEAFWRSLDGVVTALDNVPARLYVDQQCVRFRRPLVDSGTLGTKGNTQSVVPGLSENYGARSDPEVPGIPLCTLKNFPNKIEHTLQWARDWFEGEMKQGPEAFNNYVHNDDWLSSIERAPNRLELLLRVRDVAQDVIRITQPSPSPASSSSSSSSSSSTPALEACATWARMQFENLFHNHIAQLLHAFPPDTTVADGSSPFWSGAKRLPAVLRFDPKDPLHREFAITAATLRAQALGLAPEEAWDENDVVSIAASTAVPEFRPKEARIARDDDELRAMRERGEDEDDGRGEDPDDVQASLPAPADLAGRVCEAVEFEKDDELQMRLVTAASNLRARNYAIEEADLYRSKLIAGRVIPAIATTTALVVGFVGLELYKLAQMPEKQLSDFRDNFVNLAIPLIMMAEPVPCKSTVVKLPDGAKWAQGEWKWTMWDEVHIQGPMTLQGLLDWAEEQFGAEVDIVSLGPAMLYNAMMASMPHGAASFKRRAGMTIPEVAADVTGEPMATTGSLQLTLLLSPDEDDEGSEEGSGDDEGIELPPIAYHID